VLTLTALTDAEYLISSVALSIDESIGFGFLVPVFFVSAGVGLDIGSLFRSTRAVIAVRVFSVASPQELAAHARELPPAQVDGRYRTRK
jgi:hypothetical protein